jgi:trehalose/maltose hydrolase-like predicted phosphorylase
MVARSPVCIRRAALIDLVDLNHNTADGHFAALSGAWLGLLGSPLP